VEAWDEAEKALNNALKKEKIDFEIDKGEGVFYGPKVDIKLEDALGKLWQGPTIQVDFNEPEKFDVTYVGEDGKEHRAIMIHRTVLGSLERFFGCLIEHYGGKFPFWLAPVQIKIITVTEKHEKYAKDVQKELEENKIRASIDNSNESLSKRIRSAELEKVPYIVVVGDKEEKEQNLSVRTRGKKDLEKLPIDTFVKKIIAE